ncbi:MAG TPA: tetratricopeptide repeat protein [Anaerolineales bacterium]|nr:tetratricopeptide repeat protein [Anaerolineales bacterium]
MKQISLELSLILACLIAVVACDSGKPAGTTTSGGADTALMSPASSPGRADNDEGVGHYKQGHWDVATDWFKKAVKADPNLAEAHYNLALSLDKMGKHEDATAAFKKAAELAPANPAIKDSAILKKHLGM